MKHWIGGRGSGPPVNMSTIGGKKIRQNTHTFSRVKVIVYANKAIENDQRTPDRSLSPERSFLLNPSCTKELFSKEDDRFITFLQRTQTQKEVLQNICHMQETVHISSAHSPVGNVTERKRRGTRVRAPMPVILTEVSAFSYFARRTSR